MPYFYFDSGYVLVIIAFIITLIVQARLKSTFKKYSKVKNSRGYTSQDVARKILDDNGLYDIEIQRVSGNLSDHYDPKGKVIRLSDTVYGSDSVAAIGVAAHEVGHAIQYSKEYFPIKVRTAIIPITQIGSSLAVPLILIGLIIPAFSFLITFGIYAYVTIVAFQVVTLPVEFNASRRALKTLESDMILDDGELRGAKKVLSAAATTYLAALLASVATLLRYIFLSNRRN